MDCSWTDISVHGISQARILEWIPSPGHLPDPGIEPTSPALAGRLFTTSATWEAHLAYRSHELVNKYCQKDKQKAYHFCINLKLSHPITSIT